MNVVESILAVFLIALSVSGMIKVATQQYHARDAQRVVEQIGVYQDALVRHQVYNPQDGVEDWFPAQCPATHEKAQMSVPTVEQTDKQCHSFPIRDYRLSLRG